MRNKFCDITMAALIAAIAAGDSSEKNGTVYYLTAYPLALCLDGTPAAYYHRRGAELNKFLIFHEGASLSRGGSTSHP